MSIRFGRGKRSSTIQEKQPSSFGHLHFERRHTSNQASNQTTCSSLSSKIERRQHSPHLKKVSNYSKSKNQASSTCLARRVSNTFLFPLTFTARFLWRSIKRKKEAEINMSSEKNEMPKACLSIRNKNGIERPITTHENIYSMEDESTTDSNTNNNTSVANGGTPSGQGIVPLATERKCPSGFLEDCDRQELDDGTANKDRQGRPRNYTSTNPCPLKTLQCPILIDEKHSRVTGTEGNMIEIGNQSICCKMNEQEVVPHWTKATAPNTTMIQNEAPTSMPSLWMPVTSSFRFPFFFGTRDSRHTIQDLNLSAGAASSNNNIQPRPSNNPYLHHHNHESYPSTSGSHYPPSDALWTTQYMANQLSQQQGRQQEAATMMLPHPPPVLNIPSESIPVTVTQDGILEDRKSVASSLEKLGESAMPEEIFRRGRRNVQGIRGFRPRSQRRGTNKKQRAAHQASSSPQPSSNSSKVRLSARDCLNPRGRDSSPPPSIRTIDGMKVTIIDEEFKVFIIDLLSPETCNLARRMTDNHVRQVEESGSGQVIWRKLYTYTKQDLPCSEVKGMASQVTDYIMSKVINVVGEIFGKKEEAMKLRPRSWKEPHLLLYKKIEGEPAHTGVEMHYDGCDITWNAMLSKVTEYEGGGTYIRALRKTVKLRQGQVLVHPGELYHKGVDITSGMRVLIVGFTDGFDPQIVDSTSSQKDKKVYEKNVRIY